MLKISVVETHGQRKLVLEGKLAGPWITEAERAWREVGNQLQGRKLIVDLSNVTLISADGEDMLLRLMGEGAKFSCGGVLTKHVLKRLAQRGECKP